MWKDDMEVEFSTDTFTDFGTDPYFPYPPAPLSRVDGTEPSILRAEIRKFAPRCPGVYGMLDPLGRLIYVGKSKMLRNRLLSYFLPKEEDDKSTRIVESSHAIVWQPQPSEFAALLREQYLIRTFRPRFNVQGLPKRQQPIFVCLGKPPAEQLFTSRQPEPDSIAQLGPLFGASRAGRAFEVLNRTFRLRDCSSKQPCSFSEQMQLFDIDLRPGCIRLEINSCLGPCISACSRGTYDKQVALAKDYLLGLDNSAVEILEKQMFLAAADQHFEQAATIREDLKAVRWLSKRACDIKQARDNYTFVYAVRGLDCRHQPGAASDSFDIWYLIRRGVLEGSLARPLAESDKRRVRSQLAAWMNDDEQVGGQHAARPETLALITSWFRNNRSQLEHAFVPGEQRAPIARKRRKNVLKPKSDVVSKPGALKPTGISN